MWLAVYQTGIITIYDSKKRQRGSDSPGKLHGRPAGRGHGALGVAACNDVVGALGAAATLGGNAEFELDLVKAHALAGKFGNLFVANAVADADNHGGEGDKARGLNVNPL
jgi:hypothetical protein